MPPASQPLAASLTLPYFLSLAEFRYFAILILFLRLFSSLFTAFMPFRSDAAADAAADAAMPRDAYFILLDICLRF